MHRVGMCNGMGMYSVADGRKSKFFYLCVLGVRIAWDRAHAERALGISDSRTDTENAIC